MKFCIGTLIYVVCLSYTLTGQELDTLVNSHGFHTESFLTKTGLTLTQIGYF
jgi:hypothetical protein